jgi:signal transduction histidine kinase
MAKETAHQFGTPLSSLMGWHELLKINYNDPVKVQDIADELNDDLQRMNKITNRFSKIGSKVELKPVRVADDIQRVIQYFTRRIPQTGRTVNISLKGDMHATAMLNSDLFEWVLENLVKNALDAIEHADGRIEFQIKLNGKKVEIDVTDNGKGVNLKQRKDIFRPGYSTKRRGWGLGLSLSKRIIDDYHNGRIYVKNSIIGQGTTFKIILSRADENS